MKRKISLSFFLSTLGILILTVGLTIGFLSDYFGNLREDQMKEALDLASVAVENYGTDYLEKIPAAGTRFTWVAADGTVLYDTQADASAMENHGSREEIAEALETGSGQSSRYSATLLRRTIYYAIRLSDGSVLRASIQNATVLTLLLGMVRPLLLLLAVMAAAAAVIGRKLSGRIIAPLDRLDLNAPLENSDAYPEFSPLLRRIDSQNREIRDRVIQLQEKTDECDRIIQSMHEGLVILDDKWRILSISRTAVEFFGGNNSCIGQDFLLLDRDFSIAQKINEAFASGHGELDTERNGRTYHFGITRIGSDGRVVGTVLLITDITDRVRAQQSRSEFTANVSHELKTPVQSILGHAGLIVQGDLSIEDTRRFAQGIQKEAARMAALINDIMHLSRLDEGYTAPYENVDLTEAALRIAESLREEAEAKAVTVTVTGQHAVIPAPPAQVHEILFNLCSNAVRYNKEGGQVHIVITEENGQASVTVRDTGIGIPAQDLDRIFERFYRVDKSRSRATGGTGLGLSVAKHAAQIIGARISVRSTPGSGSEFTVTFPVKKSA